MTDEEICWKAFELYSNHQPITGTYQPCDFATLMIKQIFHNRTHAIIDFPNVCFNLQRCGDYHAVLWYTMGGAWKSIIGTSDMERYGAYKGNLALSKVWSSLTEDDEILLRLTV